MKMSKDDEQLQVLQKKAHFKFMLVLCISISIFILLMAFFQWCINEEQEKNLYEGLLGSVLASFTFSAGSLCIMYYLIFFPAYQKFNHMFKHKYVLNTIEKQGFLQCVSYFPYGGFTYADIFKWGVVDCGDEAYFKSEDMLCGVYKGIRFQFCDITTKRYVQSGRFKNLETVFKGQVMRFDRFDHMKISDGHLQIFQKDFFSSLRGWTAEYKIETENALFNDQFEVYANNEHNAFYILTPLFMEKIKEFSDIIDEQVAVTFYETEMMVAIGRIKSMFDANITDPVLKQKQVILDDVKQLQNAGDILLYRTSQYE